ncbi:MAG: membrane protein insertion efficiency factor YidD [Deltaproteobacteria bacterium]|nr:membrane protein insertion efficiency factor YidD [Deltaproteobacteria bacterium]
MKQTIIALIRFYQHFISPVLPSTCRFYPTCSSYAIEAISRYGLTKGMLKASCRIIKCNPFHPGGYDPV